jgi:hypothetical protein
MTVYLGKDRKHVTTRGAETHVIVTGLTAGFENVGHRLFMDSIFTLPDLHDDAVVLSNQIKKGCLEILETNMN